MVMGTLTLILAGSVLMTAEQMGIGPTFCVFKLATGLDCPGCGMTRALAALLHGDLDSAVHLHPLVVVVFPILTVMWMTLVSEVVRNRPLLSNVPYRVLNRFAVVLVVMFVSTWVVRTTIQFQEHGLDTLNNSLVIRLIHAML